ncbi:MAG: hypothetical protein MHPSP_002092 [Paramarteilia canceri]
MAKQDDDYITRGLRTIPPLLSTNLVDENVEDYEKIDLNSIFVANYVLNLSKLMRTKIRTGKKDLKLEKLVVLSQLVIFKYYV